jgi:predicted anti-sigma-YlaC factor YlaD
MECPNHETLVEYNGDGLSPLERMIVRDHLVSCPRCRSRVAEYKSMEIALREPVMIEPPMDLEKQVMKSLFPYTPSRLSLAVLWVFSFALFVTLLMVMFDVSNNGVLKALQLSSSETTGFLGTLIRLVTSSFKIIYAFYKILDAFIRVLSFGFISLEIFMLLLSLPSLMITLMIFKRKENRHHGKQMP